MATTKKQPPTTTLAASLAGALAAAPEWTTPPISDTLIIKRVDNGFTLEASAYEFGGRSVSKRVAPGAAALQTEVAAWGNPAPKKR